MATIHGMSIIHRDLKPESKEASITIINTILDVLVVDKENWEVRIADLGLSKLVASPNETLTRGILGTEAYE